MPLRLLAVRIEGFGTREQGGECARSWRKERISRSPTTDKMIVTIVMYAVQKTEKNMASPPHQEG